MSVTFSNIQVGMCRETGDESLHSVYVVADDGSVSVHAKIGEPPVVLCMPPVVMVDSGNNFYAAVCGDGTLWTWRAHCPDLKWSERCDGQENILCRPERPQSQTTSSTQEGQVRGEDAPDAPESPGRVDPAVFGGEHVVQVACGYMTMMVLTKSGRVWVVQCQYNEHDRMDFFTNKANGGVDFQGCQIRMVATSPQAVSGVSHYAALDEHGRVWTWGGNYWGALGLGLGLWQPDDDERGMYTEDAKTQPYPVRVPSSFGGEKVAMVATGPANTAAVTTGGALWVWGRPYVISHTSPGATPSTFGIRTPTLIPCSLFGGALVQSVACGQYHILVLTTCGAVWSLCDKRRLVMEKCTTLSDDCNTVHSTLTPQLVDASHFGGARIVACFANRRCSAAVTEHGALYVWGDVVASGTPTLVPTSSPGGRRVGWWTKHIEHEHTVAHSPGLPTDVSPWLDTASGEIMNTLCKPPAPSEDYYAAQKLSGTTTHA